MNSRTVLFLSNGYAEDNIACCIIEKLLEKQPSLRIKAMPFVGEGASYRRLEIQVLGPCRRMPSDGFVGSNLSYLLEDLRAGWLRLYAKKARVLKKERTDASLVVCVGDIFLVLTAVLFIKRPVIFLPTAKSDYIRQHYLVEKWLMRRKCRLVMSRDKKTTLSLKNYGINARYAGNVMMDCLKITGKDFGIDKSSPAVAIVPGSKKEAYKNLMVILDAVREISLQRKKKVNFLLALAPSLDVQGIAEDVLKKSSWDIQLIKGKKREKGVVANLTSVEGAVVKVIQGKFGDVVNLSTVVIGTAGMANEQAVGLGKPVVSFPGEGPQITEKFLRTQRKLLGGAVFITKRNPKTIAAKVMHLLENPQQLREIRKIGKERMGEPGAGEKTAALIEKELSLLK